MFVRLPKSLAALGVMALLTGTAQAQENNLSVELTGLHASEGKLYISIQKEEDFMAQRGHGGIFEVTEAGNETYAFTIPAGEYAVSIWHDTDNDERFSMDDNWVPTDGWGMSGTASADKQPRFDEVKIAIASSGTSVRIPMVYPN